MHESPRTKVPGPLSQRCSVRLQADRSQVRLKPDTTCDGVVKIAVTFSNVRAQGREWRTRFASSALALATLSAAASAQSPATFVDLAPDLASKIAATLAPATPIRLSFQKDDERVQAAVARLLAGRGFRVVESADSTVVSGGCLANLRERVCAAGIGSGEARRVVMTTGLHGGDAEANRDPVVAAELRPLYAQRGPMLDAAYEFINWYLSGWVGAFLNRQGYYTAVLDTAKKYMSPDEWDFWMEGKPAKGDILSPTGEKIESAGTMRDGGSFWDRMGRVSVWNTVMDEDRYMVRKWNEFIAA